MIRALAYLIASVLVISVVRSIIGIVLKGFADLFQTAPTAQKGVRTSDRSSRRGVEERSRLRNVHLHRHRDPKAQRW